MLRYKWRLVFGGIAIVITTALALTLPYLLGSAIDALTSLPGQAPGAGAVRPFHMGGVLNMLAAGKPQGEIYDVVGLILLLAGLQGIGEFFSRYLVNEVSRMVEYELRNDLFAHLQRMQQSFFQSVHTGDIMARATNDLSSVRAFLGPGISNSVRTILMFVIASALMIGINIKLAVIFVFFMPMVSISFVVIGRQMQNRWERVQAQFGNLSTYAQENFSGIRVVKAYAQEEYEVQHFAKANADYVRRSLAYQRLTQPLWPMI